MYFQVLSHASVFVRNGSKSILTDPWLIGSCYWRSWWNYPPVKPELVESLQPDAIYISHIHWDHFHGPSLRHFPKDIQIVIPWERSTRIKRDLYAMGYRNLVEIPHGGSFRLGDDLKLTSYQFSVWGDSAAVFEGGGVSLLDANDAKFMGGPLRQILKRHKRFDFAFRSHSSANDRICYEYTDRGANVQEDPILYAASFVNFMNMVKPRYAIPFASNQCFLHRETFPLNSTVSTPNLVQDYIASQGGLHASELKIMVSGDSWDSEKGFEIAPNTWFTERPRHLQEYLAQKKEKLEATYAQEEKTRLRLADVERYFNKFFKMVPWFLKRNVKNRPLMICAKYGNEADYFKIDLWNSKVTQIDGPVPPDSLIFETTALILKKAMALNMFSHIGISKRVVYRSSARDAKYLEWYNTLLAAYEYEVLPLNRLFSLRTARVYARRWRELVLYVRLAAGVLAGKSGHQLETEQLVQHA